MATQPQFPFPEGYEENFSGLNQFYAITQMSPDRQEHPIPVASISLWPNEHLFLLSPLVSIDDVNDCQGSIAQEEKPKKQDLLIMVEDELSLYQPPSKILQYQFDLQRALRHLYILQLPFQRNTAYSSAQPCPELNYESLSQAMNSDIQISIQVPDAESILVECTSGNLIPPADITWRDSKGKEVPERKSSYTKEVAVRKTSWNKEVAVRKTSWNKEVAVRKTCWNKEVAVRKTCWNKEVAVRKTCWNKEVAVRKTSWNKEVAVRKTSWNKEVAERKTSWNKEVAERKSSCTKEVAERKTSWNKEVAERKASWTEEVAERKSSWTEEVAMRNHPGPKKSKR
ncbi:hypothetical protein ACRRTK_016838 [Alexandromys fortis]